LSVSCAYRLLAIAAADVASEKSPGGSVNGIAPARIGQLSIRFLASRRRNGGTTPARRRCRRKIMEI
jgi:hypothetical protein